MASKSSHSITLWAYNKYTLHQTTGKSVFVTEESEECTMYSSGKFITTAAIT